MNARPELHIKLSIWVRFKLGLFFSYSIPHHNYMISTTKLLPIKSLDVVVI